MILTRQNEAASRHPEKTAIQMKVGEEYRRYTYGELARGIASAAGALAGQGIVKGDRLALLSENRPEWIFAYLATVSLGAVIVPLDAQLTDKEVQVLLKSSGARAVFVSSTCRPKIPQDLSLTLVAFDPGEGLLFDDMLAAHPGSAFPPSPGADDPAALLYTSGTTGDPKGVMLSHGNLVSNVASVIQIGILKSEDNLLCILPLHHSYPAIACIHVALSLGATVTLLNSLKGPDITACMRETAVSVMLGVPQLFAGLRRAIFDEIGKKPAVARLLVRLLLALNGLLRKTVRLNIGKVVFKKVHVAFGTALRLLASGGARLDPDVYSDMTRLGFTMIEGYGLTETSPVSTFNPLARQKPGSIGIPIPGVEVLIANPDENGQGEIAVRGPNVMLGYYQKPKETSEVLRNGWFYTGDLGYRDRDGYFFITGRSKEMIVLPTGKKIFPEELEKFYKQILEIKEICLIEGERGLEAAVVPDFEYLRKRNLSNSRQTIAFKIEDLAKDLPPYKRITGLKIFQDSLPVTRLGKLKRSVVKDLYRKGGERAEKAVQDIDKNLFDDPVAKKLLACLAPFSAKKNIVPDDNLELDLGLDSLARVEMVVGIEKTFGMSLPESFGSGLFTVREAVLKIRELLSAGPVKAGDGVRLTWAEILAREPAEEVKRTVRLEPGQLCAFGQRSLRFLLRLFFTVYNRLSVRGIENLPGHGPYIIAPNHLSLADAPAVMAAVSRAAGSQMYFLGTADYFGGPLTSRIASLLQVIPVDMDTKLYGALQLSAYVLREGKVLCVFPEGGRSRDGRIKDFKKGVGIIAKELNIPIVPVAIHGAYRMLAPGMKFPRPVHLEVAFGKPIQPGGKDYEGLVKALYEAVRQMLEEDSGDKE